MQPLTLIIAGFGLLIFGAFVLLKFPHRPGGRIAIGKIEVSSIGAGLPLIFLGVICLMASADNTSINLWPFGDKANSNQPTGFSDCFETYFEGIPADRVPTIETGTQDFDIISPSQLKDKPIGILFSENRHPVGAIRFDFFSGNQVFKIQSVADAECDPVTSYSNPDRSDKNVLQNWDTVEMEIEGAVYSLRLGYDAGVIEVNHFRKTVR